MRGQPVLPRLMLTAPRSGSGKTMMTCGLLMALKKRGLQCRAFKCGPDYIDPMFHKRVLGIDGGNLDTFFLPEETVKSQFLALAGGADISVVEGVMGYYDGVGGDSTWASSYETACAIDAPAVLILDCQGASLSLAAEAKGFLEFRKDSHIKGLILNRISPAMAAKLTPEIERLGISVFGYLAECDAARVTSRHLGLVFPEESEELKGQLERLADELEKTVDVDGLLKLAAGADPLECRISDVSGAHGAMAQNMYRRIRIGIARDEAFCFYYQENLKLLESLGGELVEFDPIRDPHLPRGVAGLIFGGGYPELYARELSGNETMRTEVKSAVERGVPVIAECGGFLYLHRELETKEGEVYPMAGVINGRAFPTGKLSRFGYIELTPYEDTLVLKKEETVRGHEFHYWESTACGTDMKAEKPRGLRSWDCIHARAGVLAGFPHLYYPSNPLVMKRWLELCEKGMNHG